MGEVCRFFGKEISGPFTIPSGIITTEVQVIEKIANLIPEIGILTTKSIGVRPNEGYKEPVIADYGDKSFVNAVGLTNPGAEEFAARLSKIKLPEDKFLLISIFGANEDEFGQVAKTLMDYADGFELNISCPHSEKYGQTVGQDTLLVGRVVRKVASLGKPTIVKISPNLNVEETVKSAIKGGASGITAINTKGPVPHLHDGHPILSNKVGGISGKKLLELGASCVREIRKLTDLPIIACGGISTAEDVRNYKLAGADFFGIGSALAGMNTIELQHYFHALSCDLKKNSNNAEKFLKSELNMDYRTYKVKENRELADDLFLLEFEGILETKPGQFVFAWIPEKGEKPFSVFDDDPLTLLVQKRGCFTEHLSRLGKGDSLYIRGPYGNSPEVGENCLLVSGGTGVAALYLFAKRNPKSTVVVGAKDKVRLVCEKLSGACKEIHISTESGEVGRKGRVTDTLEDILRKVKPDSCVNCGPEPMVRAAVRIEEKYVVPDRIYSSVERVTKCGIGLCGSCATSKGYRSCVDGTFFAEEKI